MNETLTEIESIFMAFGERTRLKLLYLMRNGEVSVNYLCETLATSQPKVSRHLAYLRSMNVVHTRRDGKRIFYSLNEPKSVLGSRLFRNTLEWVGAAPEIATSFDPVFSENAQMYDRGLESRAPQDTYGKADIMDEEAGLAVYLL